MKQLKIRFHYKYCKVGLFLTALCFVLAVLSIYESRLWTLLLFSIIDLILTVVPAFYITIEQRDVA